MTSLDQTKPELTTERLKLRRWREADLEAFARLNSDPRVMEFLIGPLTREKSDALVRQFEDHFDRHGFGFWAVEVIGGPPFIGFTGLKTPPFDAPFTPCVEIGWRLARPYWGMGYAPEAARATLRFAFQDLGLTEVVAYTATGNSRSRRVMEKLGMNYSPADDFDHPLIEPTNPLRPHVLYRIRRSVAHDSGLPSR